MSAATTVTEFAGQKVASLMRRLSCVQIVATPSRQFRKTDMLRAGFIPSFRIVSTLSTQLARSAFKLPCTVAGVSFALLIGVNDE